MSGWLFWFEGYVLPSLSYGRFHDAVTHVSFRSRLRPPKSVNNISVLQNKRLFRTGTRFKSTLKETQIKNLFSDKYFKTGSIKQKNMRNIVWTDS